MGDSVQVAVRVRPYNAREKELNSKRCIFMSGTNTTIKNLAEDTEKTFNFDYSYDSFCADDECYATQGMVFNDLGENVLKNAWEGFNCSLFAYGQTGAGKSYSVVGYGEQKGIVPLTCEEMFNRIHKNDNPKKTFHVTVSMLEIYNEKIWDLLVTRDKQPNGGLVVRETPQGGVFIKDLSHNAVESYKEVEDKMEQGNSARTVAATQMNATSSRAHTVFIVVFKQIEKQDGGGKDAVKESKINLVDLAGSERSSKTGATGDRLKEGANINKSLSMLGLVIHALAEASNTKKKKKIHVPYRDSKLTHLLKESLGGNSKTIMIAALSPSDNNYDETLSTLRYADSAKRIKNKAVVNENPTDKLIRELKEEIAKLKTGAVAGDGGGGGGGGGGPSPEELLALQATIAANEAMIADMNKSWEEKLAESQQNAAETENSLASAGIVSGAAKADRMTPHWVNLNEDPLMSESLIYHFGEGDTTIGSKKPDDFGGTFIMLRGLNVKKEHARITVVEEDDPEPVAQEDIEQFGLKGVRTDGKVAKVQMTVLDGAKTYVNGKHITTDEPLVLNQGDRVLLGNSQMFRMNHPMQAVKKRIKREKEGPEAEEEAAGDWNAAQAEMAMAQGQMADMFEQQKKMKEEEEKRKAEYEAKLKEMEDRMHKEQEEAMARLEAQRREFEAQAQAGGGANEAELEKVRMEEERLKAEQAAAAERMRLEEIRLKKETEDIDRRKREEARMQDQLLQLLPKITEVNDIVQELGRQLQIKAVLQTVVPESTNLSPLEELRQSRQVEAAARVTETDTGATHDWSYDKFMNRYYIITDMYQTFSETGQWPAESDDDDPLYDPPEAYCLGKAHVYLEAMGYMLDIQDWTPVVDYRGGKGGELRVEIVPVDADGDPDNVDFVDEPSELLGKRMDFEIRVKGLRGLSSKYMDIFVTHQFYDEEDSKETEHIKRPKTGGVGELDYVRHVSISSVRQDHLDYFEKDAVTFEVMGYIDLEKASGAQKKQLQKNKEQSVAEKSLTSSRREEAIESKHDVLGTPGPGTGAGAGPTGSPSSSKAAATPRAAPVVASRQKSLKNLTEAQEQADEAGSGPKKCQICDDDMADWKCKECGLVLCDDCDAMKHKKAARAGHDRSPLHKVANATTVVVVGVEKDKGSKSCLLL